MIILQNNAAVSVSNMSEESRLPEEQADVRMLYSHWYSNWSQVHSDQRVPDVNPGMRLYALYRYRVIHVSPRCC